MCVLSWPGLSVDGQALLGFVWGWAMALNDKVRSFTFEGVWEDSACEDR